jgi:transposase-like protein
MPMIPLAKLLYKHDAWPRSDIDPARVEMFLALLKDGEVLPPIEVVARDDDTFLICDGVHRSSAAISANLHAIETTLVFPLEGESATDCAFRRALETSTRSAKPLTRAERRRAALRLHKTRSDMSRREIARLVGVAHSTVDRWVAEVADSATRSEEDPFPTRGPTPDEVARRLTAYLGQLEESRGLLDLIAGKRMGGHLARALADRFEESALAEARRFQGWITQAITVLEAET